MKKILYLFRGFLGNISLQKVDKANIILSIIYFLGGLMKNKVIKILKKGINHNIVAFLFLVYSILLLIFSLGILFISCLIYFFLGIRIILIRNSEKYKREA